MLTTIVCVDCKVEVTYERRGGYLRLRCDECLAVDTRKRKREHRARTYKDTYVSVAKTMAKCSDCGASIVATYGPNGGRTYLKRCADCHLAKLRRKWRRALARKHGLTVEAYDAMLAAQGGSCAVPGCERTDDGRGRSLHIDHDHACCPGEHSCGRCVRGLLCAAHNIGIGYFQNDPAALEAAASYLRTRRPQVSAA